MMTQNGPKPAKTTFQEGILNLPENCLEPNEIPHCPHIFSAHFTHLVHVLLHTGGLQHTADLAVHGLRQLVRLLCAAQGVQRALVDDEVEGAVWEHEVRGVHLQPRHPCHWKERWQMEPQQQPTVPHTSPTPPSPPTHTSGAPLYAIRDWKAIGFAKKKWNTPNKRAGPVNPQTYSPLIKITGSKLTFDFPVKVVGPKRCNHLCN